MIIPKRPIKGLVDDELSMTFRILRIIFSVVILSVAIIGLVSVIAFSCVHWTSFS